MMGRHLASSKEWREIDVESLWHFKICRWSTEPSLGAPVQGCQKGGLSSQNALIPSNENN